MTSYSIYELFQFVLVYSVLFYSVLHFEIFQLIFRSIFRISFRGHFLFSSYSVLHFEIFRFIFRSKFLLNFRGISIPFYFSNKSINGLLFFNIFVLTFVRFRFVFGVSSFSSYYMLFLELFRQFWNTRQKILTICMQNEIFLNCIKSCFNGTIKVL